LRRFVLVLIGDDLKQSMTIRFCLEIEPINSKKLQQKKKSRQQKCVTTTGST